VRKVYMDITLQCKIFILLWFSFLIVIGWGWCGR
jgi:hypothetical protein